MTAIISKFGALFATGLIAATGAVPALAANVATMQTNASIKSALTADAPSASDLVKIESQEDADQAQIDALTKQSASASCGWDCIDRKLKALGDKMITNRVNALNEVKTYVAGKQNITDADRTELLNKLNANLSEMTTLKAKIDADTNHTTLVADVESITVNYREYMLVIPQVSLMASADHKEYVYTQLSATAADLQTKIDAMADSNEKAAAQAKLDDMKAKIADAKTNADAVIVGIKDLTPDQGDAAHRKANKAALDLATTQVLAAHQDYVAARADVDAINAILKGSATVSSKKPVTGTHPIVPVHPITNPVMKVSPAHPAISTHASVNVSAK